MSTAIVHTEKASSLFQKASYAVDSKEIKYKVFKDFLYSHKTIFLPVGEGTISCYPTPHHRGCHSLQPLLDMPCICFCCCKIWLCIAVAVIHSLDGEWQPIISLDNLSASCFPSFCPLHNLSSVRHMFPNTMSVPLLNLTGLFHLFFLKIKFQVQSSIYLYFPSSRIILD